MPAKQPKSESLSRVGECLYRNSKGTYFALIKVGGKQIKRSLQTTDRDLARRNLADLRAKVKRLHGSESKNIRFDELAELWLESIKPSLKPKSYERREVALVGLKPFFKGMSVRSIGFSEIDEWRKKRGADISARSHNIELETLSLILKYGCDRGVLLDNPAAKFKRKKQPKTLVEMPSRAEFNSIVKALRESPWSVTSGAADMVEFLAYSGARVGEAREVRFRDVDFTAGRLTITGGAGGTKNHEPRTIPLFLPLRTLLVRMLERQKPANPHAPLFKIDSPRGALAAACKRAGVRDFNVHSLRHFFATNALEQGVTPKSVSEWLGHKDGGVLVLQRYGHLRQEFSMKEAEKMTFQAAA